MAKVSAKQKRAGLENRANLGANLCVHGTNKFTALQAHLEYAWHRPLKYLSIITQKRT